MIKTRFCKITTPLVMLFFAGVTAIHGQEAPPSDEVLQGLKEKAVVLFITARIIESNKEVVWNASDSKITISGRTVSVKLTGNNIVIVGQFTPYISADGTKLLVAQGQVWIDVPDEGVHYYTNIQTMPLEFGEQIFFFPLGAQKQEKGTRIEIQLVLKPYEGQASSPQPSKETVH